MAQGGIVCRSHDKRRVTRLDLDLPTKSQRYQHSTFFAPSHQDNKYCQSPLSNFKTTHAEFQVSFEPARELDFSFTYEDEFYTTDITNGLPHSLIPPSLKYNARNNAPTHHHLIIKPQPQPHNNHNRRNQSTKRIVVQTARVYFRRKEFPRGPRLSSKTRFHSRRILYRSSLFHTQRSRVIEINTNSYLRSLWKQ